MEKTNAMRILERAKIGYTVHIYEGGALSGVEVAKALGQDPACAFKTLVTVGSPRKYYVFVIPVAAELDLKKAAKAAGEKSIEMIPQKELFPLTGYVHGGCSPVGMKKLFKTTIDRSAEQFAAIAFSAGKRGRQVQTSLQNLAALIPFSLADLTV